ncbi:MAG: ATP-binding cassette domain-containing protein [Candidatus Cloacimonetes bacterium]|nr:ATP-binding cassette domain-containing protein [Candidatus Cloacimonadota bacterium]
MLKIENLKIYSGDKPVLEVESFYLTQGRNALIIGNNCSGKSLLLKTLGLEYDNFEGVITLKDKPLKSYQNKQGTILIDRIPRLLTEQTIWQNLIIPFINPNKRQRDRINSLLESVLMSDKIYEKAGKLSFSEQRIVEIIRAVIQLPFIIMLDDYDEYFDEETQKHLHEVFDYAIKGGTSIIASAKRELSEYKKQSKIENGKLIIV